MTTMTYWVSEHAGRTRRLMHGALASLVVGGLSVASILQEWGGGRSDLGFTAGSVLDLFAVLPGIVVLLALLELATAAGSTRLYRSSLCLYSTGWFTDLLRLFISENLSDVWAIVLIIPLALAVLAIIIFKIWFAVALIRLRDRLGGLAGMIGALVLLNLGAWLVFGVLSVIGDESGALDRVDTVRGLVSVVLNALLLFMLFLNVRDRLLEGSQL